MTLKPFFIVGLCLLFAACMGAGSPTFYYTLSPADIEPPDDSASADVAIGVGPVVLPDYLDRLPIVSRSGPHRLKIDDLHRWAGPLQEEIMRVLKQNLAMLTGSNQVTAYPWRHDSAPALQVSLNVLCFEGDGQKVSLDAQWHVVDTTSGRTLDYRQTTVEVPNNGKDTESMVAAMSKAVGVLGEKIAAAIIDQRPEQ